MKTAEFIILFTSVCFYIRHILVTKFIPSPVAFAIWLIADVINFFTYTIFSEYWIAPAIMPCSALAIVIIGIVKSKKTDRMSLAPVDWVCIGICIVSLIVWALSNALWSNMVIQVIIALGFVPMMGNLFKKKIEPLLPWFLMIVGYSLIFVDTAMGCKNSLELVYPGISLLGSIIIFFGSWLIIRRRMYGIK